MKQLRFVQTGYLFGITLVLASIFYFFASNWQGMERLEKVILSLLLMVFMYAVSFILSKRVAKHPFLSNWSLVASAVSFGVSAALIGQVYNSHADSYWLFIVWLIPSLLLAAITRYQPFYILCFVLGHLAFLSLISPSGYDMGWSNSQEFFLYLALAGANLILFLCTYKRWIHSSFVLYASLILFNITAVYLTTVHEFHSLAWLMNLIYLLILGGAFYYFIKIKLEKGVLFILGAAAAGYVCAKGIELMAEFFQELFLFLQLGFSALLVFGAVLLLKYISTHPMNAFFRNVLIICVTFVATIFAVSAIIGLISLLTGNLNVTFLFFSALVVLVIPSLFFKWPPPVRYTMLSTGYAIQFLSAAFNEHIYYEWILLAVLLFGMMKIKVPGIQVMHFLLLNLTAFMLFRNWTHEFQYAGITFLVLNGLFYQLKIALKETRWTALGVAFGYFLALAMLNDIPIALYVIYNLFYFAAATAMVWFANRNQLVVEWYIAIIFWFLFVAYKYYDFAWDLLNKSLFFAIVGILFIVCSVLFDRKNVMDEGQKHFVKTKWPAILAVILLQIGIISYQGAANENLLKNGQLIKLSFAPVDPRSMMQGDYIQLHYRISVIPDIAQQIHKREKVKVVLRKGMGGYYEYSGYYEHNGEWNRPYKKLQGDVIINGRYDGWQNVTYGIETYFVPEKTGQNLQNENQAAFIRVSENGNAIIEKLEKE
ncbi:GDYXXLXY domain-containing protein [Falsibacillus pallidus]|uniref:Putative membrane-anchored protein n=1 Tax=Falsibacillus pallidus TaxID=493781 RepID=A0A370GU18_9BACI|nr:GDYXXLXY domain-containing protein [Falsibacillus pallidus]RDI45433.1 putative membrane-anchored protein [Falsibacillus pallidus]